MFSCRPALASGVLTSDGARGEALRQAVDGVQQLLLLALQGGVVGGDVEQLVLQLADDGRLARDDRLELLLLPLNRLQLQLPLLLHVTHPLLQEAVEEGNGRLRAQKGQGD